METRTSDELKNPDYNYYFAYNIDPNEKDSRKIETTIKTIKNKFTQGTPTQRRLSVLLDDAIEVMTNEQNRKAEFNRAKEFKLNTIHNGIVNILRGRKVIYKSNLIKLETASGNWLTVKDIEDKIAYLFDSKQGGKIIDDTKGNLNFAVYDQVISYLKTLGKRDLYELLSENESSSISAIKAKSAKLYSSVSGTTAIATATKGICGCINTVFKDESTKKKYDEYLATKEIWDDFNERNNLKLFELEINEYLGYAEKAKIQLKTNNIDYVEVLLAEGLKKFSLSVRGGTEGGIDLEECPYCRKAYKNDEKVKTCPHCQNPLEIICWNCGGKAPFTVKKHTCPVCGADKEHNSRFDIIVKKIDYLLIQPDMSITTVQTELNNLKNILPDFTKAPNSTVAKKVSEYQSKIDKKVQEEQTLGNAYKQEYEKIQELVNLKKLMTASSAVVALKNKYPSYNINKTDALANSINASVMRVKQCVEKAKIYATQNNEDLAVNEIATALELAKDYIDAVQIISKFPPKPPDSVNVQVKEGFVLVSWAFHKPQKLATFSVIRKIGSRPTSIADGTVVASDLGINFFEDKTIVSDTPYYYAVFSSRLGVNSPLVFAQTLINTYFDVSNIRQEIISNKIVVKWEVPLNVTEVEVIKKRGLMPPSNRNDGQKIAVKHNEYFEDSDFDKAGNSYLFTCLYKNNQSKGVVRTYKAFEELKPLANVKIEQDNTTSFTLTTEKISAGKRGIYYSTQDINCKLGTTQQIAEFKNFYKDIKETNLLTADEHIASFSLPPDKIYHVYPFVCNEQLLIVSKPFIVNTMIGVSRVNYTLQENEVIITGQLHRLATSIIAKVSNEGWVENINAPGDKLTALKIDFEQRGGIYVKLKQNADSYISIFAETESEGNKSITCGVRLPNVITLKEKITVWYKMTVNPSTTKQFPIKIEFETSTAVTLPELTIVKGSPRPLSINDGQLVTRIPELTLKKGLFSSKFKASTKVMSDPVTVNTKFALYQSSGGGYITLKEVRNL